MSLRESRGWSSRLLLLMGWVMFTTSTAIYNRLSQAGVAFMSDDGPADSSGAYEVETSIVEQAISYADTRIEYYVNNLVESVGILQGNAYLGYAATAFACQWLCTRRGQVPPQAIQDEQARYEEELITIKLGESPIPGFVAPEASNLTAVRDLGRPRAVNFFGPSPQGASWLK